MIDRHPINAFFSLVLQMGGVPVLKILCDENSYDMLSGAHYCLHWPQWVIAGSL